LESRHIGLRSGVEGHPGRTRAAWLVGRRARRQQRENW